MKPTGIWSIHNGIPAWAGFAQLVAEYLSDDELRWAAAYAAGRHAAGKPFGWVLALTGPHKYSPMAEWLPATVARLDASGVRPFIAAVSYREEWYGHDADVAAVDRTRAWINLQHAEIRRRLPGLPIVAIELFWCPSPVFGPVYYRPDYDCDIRAIECYVPPGHTWASELLDLKLTLACGEAVGPYQLARKPVVLIPQAFRQAPHWPQWPSDETVTHTARWLAHQTVIASWPFEWATLRRGEQVVVEGWADWPERHKLAAWGMR